jgi:hypothetical protein
LGFAIELKFELDIFNGLHEVKWTGVWMEMIANQEDRYGMKKRNSYPKHKLWFPDESKISAFGNFVAPTLCSL